MTPAEDPGKDKGKPTLGPPSSPGPANKSADKQPETMQCPSYTYIWNSGAPRGSRGNRIPSPQALTCARNRNL